MINPDGKCHSFDADANGYMRSEGVLVFAIKLLENAERDGDYIHAIIEVAAVNAASTVGLTGSCSASIAESGSTGNPRN